jgi:sterol desaturase/sphingolipid hydroxylase (fatty acid hydroxylase superfamily)
MNKVREITGRGNNFDSLRFEKVLSTAQMHRRHHQDYMGILTDLNF